MTITCVYDAAKRKLSNFRKDPVGSLAWRMRACSNRFKHFKQEARPERLRMWINQLCHRSAERQLRKRGYLDFLRLRPPHALPPDFADLWFLYKVARKRRPRYILEFGSGCSTVILAQALWDNQEASAQSGGYLYSIDSDPYWAEVTAKSLPQHLLSLVEIWHSPLLEVDYDGTPAWRHGKVPDVAPDLLYLDSPPPTPERMVALDPLDIEDRFPSRFCLIVDGRVENSFFLREHLKRQYSFKYRKLFQNFVFELIA